MSTHNSSVILYVVKSVNQLTCEIWLKNDYYRYCDNTAKLLSLIDYNSIIF